MPSTFEAALKPLAAAAIALLKSEFDANEAALAADADKAGVTLAASIEARIIAGLPRNGILANTESAVVKSAITSTAAALAAQIPAGVNWLAAEIDAELAQLEKNLGG